LNQAAHVGPDEFRHAVKRPVDASGGHGYAGDGCVLRVAPGVDMGEGAPA